MILVRKFLSAPLVVGATLAFLAGCDGERPRPTGDVGCVSCHSGIEHIHADLGENACVLCHGGNGAATEQDIAHVPIPEDWKEIRGEDLPPAEEGFIKDFRSDQLSRLDPAYLRFINPSDLRVVGQTCGKCHEEEARTVPTSVMATNAGHYFPSLYLSGTQDDREAIYGSMGLTVDDCFAPGTSCELTPLRSPGQEAIESAIYELNETGETQALEDVAYKHYLSKNCNGCHQSSYSANNSPGLYRSSGCASCHVPYDEDGLYRGGDEAIDSDSPVHGKSHELTVAIESSQCASCHFQGGRIGLLYRGIREGGFDEVLPFAETIDRPLYGHPPGFYVTDEDTRNDVDETPPDVHFQLGMHCGDCHIGSDVHGDGKLHASSKTQVDIQCEDCHGDVRQAIQSGADGRFLTSTGRHLKQLHRDESGRVILTGIVDGEEHVVPQPALLLAELDSKDPMHRAMAPDPHGWSHADSLTCDSCHTSYNQQCVGCHVTYDLRFDSLDGQTGTDTPGVTLSARGFTSLEQILLGQRADGRIQSVIASQQVQLSVIGSAEMGGDGARLLGDGPSSSGWERGKFRGREGKSHPGFAPFFQHTTSAKARTCSSCHRKDGSPEELARVRGIYGYGTPEFRIPGADGEEMDPFRFLDDEGKQLSAWQQANTGAVNEEAREAALAVILDGLPQ